MTKSSDRTTRSSPESPSNEAPPSAPASSAPASSARDCEAPADGVATGASPPPGGEAADQNSGPGIRLPSGFVIDVRSFMLTGLFVIAAVAALSFAKPVIMPVVLAVLLSFLLTPLVSLLGRIGIPPGIGAALVLALVIAVIAGGLSQLFAPASRWMETLPAQIDEIEDKLRAIRGPIESVERATEQVEDLATPPESPVPAADEPVQVEVRGASLPDIVIAEMQGAAIGLILVTTLLYFLLASGDHFLQKLVKAQTRLADKKRAVEIVRQVKSDVSIYLLTITLINAGLGAATGIAMYLVGMPNPLLWGVVAAVLNFVPYLGAITGAAIVGLAAAVHFDTVGQTVLVPGVFLTLTTLEGYIVTPLILGARLMLSPVVIFIGLLFWSWLWGIPGALIAVPMLVSMKIICDHIEPLQPVGEFLGQ